MRTRRAGRWCPAAVQELMSAVQQSVISRIRRTMFGSPIPNSKAHNERLSPFLGLPVFSSDALSSVAYATEAILLILVYLSAEALKLQIWISLAIVALIVFVSIAYRQTIKAYPGGGGSYIVASDNLGRGPGLVAAAALLIDYVLTVSVSVAAGIAAILSAFPTIRNHVPDASVTLSVLCIAIVAFANLRGLRESGAAFAVPTYGFIITLSALIIFAFRAIATTPVITPTISTDLLGKEASAAHWFIILRAFAAGCTALTGIEAVSNGVQAFKPPESKNAAKVLTMMSSILTFLFLGLGYIALHLPEHFRNFSIYESNNPKYLTLTAQVAAFTFGQNSLGFYVVQVFVALILILAANTAFADFPRLASLISRDGFLPRYLSRVGDRLVFHNGIIVLAAAAAVLVFVFKGQLDLLLPLYAVGVFTAFTLSQTGMVVHWFRNREPGWQQSAVINSIGAFLCFCVLLIIGVTKFREGAWLVIVLIPTLCAGFVSIHKWYASTSKQVALQEGDMEPEGHHIAVLLVPRLNRGILAALAYSRQIKGEHHAIHVMLNEHTVLDLRRSWEKYVKDIPLEVVPSPYRSLIDPITGYVDQLQEQHPEAMITVLVAESVAPKWWHKLLQENVAQQLKTALARRENVVVANPRYFIR